MRFTCPTCNQIVQAADEAAGQVVQCPTCKQRLRVPGGVKPAPVDKTVPGRPAPETPYMATPRPAPAPPPPEPRELPERRERGRDDWEDDRSRGRRDRDEDDYDYPRRPRQASIGLAIASLVCGIVGVVFSWCVFIGPICGLLGIVFGGIHLSHKVKNGNGLAIGGLATGAAGLVIFLFILIIALASNQPMRFR